ncbi:hypothetical protein BGW38_001992, partial [Lunasporangiospora selenospora]
MVLEDRQAFVTFMDNEGYDIILCDTEDEIDIARDCKEEDVIVSADSDLLIYANIRTMWRPMLSQFTT